MTTRRASCSCGQLQLVCEGEPVRTSMCHCLECQRRTGAVLSNQARFSRKQISVEGRSTRYARVADSGNTVAFQFCPVCGSTVYWELDALPDVIAVAVHACLLSSGAKSCDIGAIKRWGHDTREAQRFVA